MFSEKRILSSRWRWSTGALGALAVLGFAVGVAVGPVATRGQIGGSRLDASIPAAPATLRSGHPAEVLRIIDGDTFEARVRVWPGIDITTKIRLRGIDAPETYRPRCPAEQQKGLAARDALQAILDQGDVQVSAVALDKYGGRVVADASTRATPDVSAALLAAGHVRSYAGGRRDGWC